MKKLVLIFASILALIFVLNSAAEDVEVGATVDRRQVGVGDVVHLTVVVSAQNSIQVEPPRLPTLPGFDLINTSSGSETRSSFINGKFQTTQSRNFTYMLAVTQKGSLTIPEIPVVVEGKVFKTQPIVIVASNSRSQPPQAQRGQQQPQAPFQEMDEMEELFNQMLQRRLPPGTPGFQGQQPPVNPDEAFLIVAQSDKSKAFVGEQVTVNFYLYTRGQVRDIDTLKYPDLKGFWKEELEMATRLNFEQAIINGMAYQRALLVSYALFPIKPGKSVIDPYKAKCTVLTPSNFGFGRAYQFTKASRPIPIEVLEVPSHRPPNYSGAVGHYRITAAFEPPTGSVNQPVTLRVRFEGQGNAKLIELPKLDLPPTFEIYDQKSHAKYMKDGSSFKEFEVMIIPREPGVFDIPAISASVFDPQSQKFSSVSSPALNITVTGSASTQAAAPTLPSATGQDDFVNADTAGGVPGLATELGESTLSAGLSAALVIAMYLAAFILLGWQGWIHLRHKPKRVSLNLVLKRRLKKLHALAERGEWRPVGVELTNAIYYILGQISEQGGANQELHRLLEHTPPSLRNELSAPLEKLVSQCEALSFAPEKMLGDMNAKPKLEALIKEFESVMGRAITLAEI